LLVSQHVELLDMIVWIGIVGLHFKMHAYHYYTLVLKGLDETRYISSLQ